MSFLPSMPKASLLDVFKAYPELAAPIHEFAHALMRGRSPFSEGERELIAAYVSSINHCEYCRNSHTAVAERFGVASELVDNLVRDVETADVPERLRPVMRYVKKLNDTPGEVGEADVDAIFDAGWDEAAVVHAALIEAMALHNHMLDEEPRLSFMHFFAIDDPTTLARGLRAALDQMAVAKS